MHVSILIGDALQQLATLPDCSVNCCVTSPPYYGLRDYGVAGQIGLEVRVEDYVAKLVTVFREVRRVLRDDGTLWLNLGDSYAGGENRGRGKQREITSGSAVKDQKERNGSFVPPGKYGFADIGVKPKDLIGIPWRVAFALQADGWYLRQDIIWHKPNPMPESVKDRCTKAHEYMFLFSKRKRYYYDADAIKTKPKQTSIDRLSQPNHANQKGSNRVPGKTNGAMKAVFGGRQKHAGYETRIHSGREDQGNYIANGVNRRSVWTVATSGYKGAHFATFPPALIEPCIIAGCPENGTVLDPFGGSGTTGQVAKSLCRNAILIELNEKYKPLIEKRCCGKINQDLEMQREMW